MRITMELTPEAAGAFESLKRELDVPQDSDVVRFALRTLQWVVEHKLDANPILVVSEGVAREAQFSFLERLRSPESRRPAITRTHEAA